MCLCKDENELCQKCAPDEAMVIGGESERRATINNHEDREVDCIIVQLQLLANRRGFVDSAHLQGAIMQLERCLERRKL